MAEANEEFTTTKETSNSDATRRTFSLSEEARSGADNSRDSSRLACDSFFTAEENIVCVTLDKNYSRRRTRSAARNSSMRAAISMTEANISTSASSTIFRRATDSSANYTMTPQLDHVLSFHQKVSPSMFHPDAFSSFRLGRNTPSSRESRQSYFRNWRFYSPDSGDGIADDIPPNSSDEISLSDSDASSFNCGHQAIHLSRSCANPPATKSMTYLSKEGVSKLSITETSNIHYTLRRSKSLSALSTSPAADRPVNSLPVRVSLRGISGSIARNTHAKNSAHEAMRFACRASDVPEVDKCISPHDTFEIIDSLDKSARNGKRLATGKNLVVKPFRQIQRVVNRILS